ncbi:hypothetical protein F4009_22635 [Candidatus Poribacteria bacterium]|nr:hypothetical protein [Candidatus Poribacteria bacterium]MYK96755.1 hypothetical protein [Candidatus Poribacteria bacterium]
MMKKTDKFSTILDDNVVPILRVTGEEKDPNWQDVQSHGLSNYLRERHWIKQADPTKRWNNRKIFNFAGSTELRLSDLGRKLDDPGDAFYELFLLTYQYVIHLRTWFEVTEVFLPEQAKMVNRFIQEYNGLRGKEIFDADQFLKDLNLGRPDICTQLEMVDKVIDRIKKKAKKGCEEGSYKSLVNDYGRGQLIVGLPLWFATYPSDLMDPSTVLTDFSIRLKLALKEIKNSVLRTNWCPFDSVVILWNPTLEAINDWVKVADIDFYSDPANYSLKSPFSFTKGYSFWKKHNFPKPSSIKNYVRWDRYPSLNSMLADQRRLLRFTNNSRPLGPKTCLNVRKSKTVIDSLRMEVYMWILQFLLYVRVNGWRSLRRRICSQFSVRRLFSVLRLIYQMRKLYRSSTSNRSKSNDNDRSDQSE